MLRIFVGLTLKIIIMFAILKEIKGRNVEMLNDYDGNGRLIIDGVVACYIDWVLTSNDVFIQNGWKVVENESYLLIQSGYFKGYPILVDLLPKPWKHFRMNDKLVTSTNEVRLFEEQIRQIIEEYKIFEKRKMIWNTQKK